MESGTVQTQLADVLHVVSQALLVPVIILLIAFIAYALYCIGSIVAEALGERRNYRTETPRFLKALMDARDDELPEVICASGLLNRQKFALLTVYDYRTLPGDALVALIRRLVSEEETHYRRIVGRNNVAAKVSPMIGLMGTLIPLGPGVAALGQADTAALSSSLLIAFDTTVAGLIVAAICLIIGKIRSTWYDDYLSALDSAMATMLEKIGAMDEAGELAGANVGDYAQRFAAGLGKKAPKGMRAAALPASDGSNAASAVSEEHGSGNASPFGETAGAHSASSTAPGESGVFHG